MRVRRVGVRVADRAFMAPSSHDHPCGAMTNMRQKLPLRLHLVASLLHGDWLIPLSLLRDTEATFS